MAENRFLNNTGLLDVLQKLKQVFAPINHTHTGYVPSTRTVNGKALSSDIVLTASDIGVTPITSIPLSNVTGADDLKAIEALSGTAGYLKKTAANTWSLDNNSYALSNHSHSNYVPTSRTINGSPLTSDISLTAYQVGAIARELRQVQLTTSGWVASSGAYTQRVTKDTNNNNLNYTANSTPIMSKCPSYSYTKAQMDAYNTAFNIVCRGTAQTGAGYVDFKVYELPATSIVVVLKGE